MNTNDTQLEALVPDAVFSAYGARLVRVKKDDVIFHEGETATHFHAVKQGRIKMVNLHQNGREFVQGYFSDGQTFGEPPFFNRLPYPSDAVAVEDGLIWKCSHENFLRLLRENFDIHYNVTLTLSGRLLYKSMMLAEIAGEEAEHRLFTLLAYLAHQAQPAEEQPYKIPLTRQQLADMTGLRVETVIRGIKLLQQKGRLEIDAHGKILWRSGH